MKQKRKVQVHRLYTIDAAGKSHPFNWAAQVLHVLEGRPQLVNELAARFMMRAEKGYEKANG